MMPPFEVVFMNSFLETFSAFLLLYCESTASSFDTLYGFLKPPVLFHMVSLSFDIIVHNCLQRSELSCVSNKDTITTAYKYVYDGTLSSLLHVSGRDQQASSSLSKLPRSDPLFNSVVILRCRSLILPRFSPSSRYVCKIDSAFVVVGYHVDHSF